MKLASEFNGEIICADSRTIYKDMDIGTAKPTVAEQREVPHWGLDLINPGDTFSAAKFKRYADAKIPDIQNRGKLPILVGGTGLYIDGVLYDFQFINKQVAWRRLVYSWISIDKLQKIIQKHGWQLPENARNKRHLIRTIERSGQVGSRRDELPGDVLLLGIMPSDAILKKHIAKRAQKMFNGGVIAETEALLKHYGDNALRSSGALIYSINADLLRSKISKSEALEQSQAKDWQYARRQKTWFRRNPDIKWFTSPDAAYKDAKKVLLNT